VKNARTEFKRAAILGLPSHYRPHAALDEKLVEPFRPADTLSSAGRGAASRDLRISKIGKAGTEAWSRRRPAQRTAFGLLRSIGFSENRVTLFGSML
jgi:hypothetical protein